ncbi:MAG TPA: hypothetical protein VGR69_00250 [Candidatus Rubrimentiphilum sp.]|nr:hypothetical protein [Candidatus Rubrimentiphilum sp.]
MVKDDATNHHVYTHPGPVEHWRHLVEIVALIIAAAWGFYVFVYQERIKPSYEHPVAEISVAVSHQPLHGDKELVSVTLSIKNIGPVPLQLDGIVMNVYGVRYTDRVTAQVQRVGSRTLTLHTLGEAPRALLATSMVLYPPLGGPSVSGFAPGREKNPTFSFAVKRNAYDAVSVDYGFCYQRADDTRHINYMPRKDYDGAYDPRALLSLQGRLAAGTCGTGISLTQGL